MTRNNVFVGDRRVLRRYIGDRLIFDDLADKTEMLSGTEIFTEQADDEGAVHVGVDGKSYQHAGSGKNLFLPINLNTTTKTISGLTPNSSYTMSSNVPKSDPSTLYFNGVSTTSNAVWENNPKTHISTESGSLTYIIYTNREYTQDLINSKYWIQLEAGSIATAYEPPAPTPDYPIEIHSLNDFDVVSSSSKGNLLENGDFSADLLNWSSNNLVIGEVSDKTLKIRASVAGGRIYYNTIRMPIGRSYILSYSVMSPQGGVIRAGQGGIFLDREIISKPTWQRVNVPITSVHATNTLSFYLQTINVDFYIKDIVLLEDTTENSHLDKLNLSLDEPLRSVGNVKDRLFRDTDGLWKVERNVKEGTFNGAESHNYYSVYDTETNYCFGNNTIINRKYVNGEKSNSLNLVANHNIQNKLGEYECLSLHTTAPGFYYIRINKSRLSEGSVLVSFKAWLNENPIIFQYALSSPTIETLPQPLQNKLNNLRSFEDSNYVYTVQPDKSNILQENLKPTLHATFKSIGWETFRKKVTKEE